MFEDYLQVGVITTTHGIRGEVKVYPTTDDIKRFSKLKEVVMQSKRESITLEIEGVKYFKNMVILKFKNYDSIEAIEKYKQCPLLVSRENAVKLKRNEFFVADLQGLKVIDDSETLFGTLRDVMETGANDVYIIDTVDGNEVLIPAIKECVLDIDMQNRIMKIHIMDGLLD